MDAIHKRPGIHDHRLEPRLLPKFCEVAS